MKKYLFNLFFGIFIASLILLPQNKVLAQFPTFEVYSAGGTKYPTVSNVQETDADTTVVVTASIADASGVSSASVSIVTDSGTEMETAVMYDDGAHQDGAANDGVYGALLGTAGLSSNTTYYINIVATDRLLNSSGTAYNRVANFNFIAKSCKTSGSVILCILIPAPSNSSTISDFTLSSSSISVGAEVTMTATLSSAVANQRIYFRDNTSGATIGSSLTNSSGVATYTYTPAFSATHTLQAVFQGNNLLALNPSYKTTSLTVSGSCQTSGSATLCIQPPNYTTININSLTVDPTLVQAGDSVTLTATLSSSVTGITITFYDTTAGTTIGTATTNASGVATKTYDVPSDATPSDHTLTATYAGSGSSKTTTLTVTGISLSGWSYRKAITISKTNVSSNLTNFPLYVKISGDADIGAGALSTGYDIRFTSSAGALLSYERESWTGGGGTAVTANFWVTVPTISSTSDTVIYIYYGKSGSEDGQDKTSVWDSNYKAVWHLNQ